MCYAVKRGIRLVALTFAVLTIGSCGGGGGGGGGNNAPAGSKLFVADSGTDVIGSVVNTNPPPGTIRVDRVITGTSSNGITGNIPALFLGAVKDELYVSNEASIFVFNSAGTANGAANFNRRIATRLAPSGNFNSLSLDSTHDILYVGDSPNGVRVYDNASTVNEVGGPPNPPSRTFSGHFGTTFFVQDIAVDSVKDILYVAVITSGPSTMPIFAFDNASTVNPSLPPNRTISVTTLAVGTMGLFLDAANDWLYFADSDRNVFVLEPASTQHGALSPVRTLILPSIVTRLAVDVVNDSLYAAAPMAVGSMALYIVPGVSTASGSIAATAALPPSGSDFTAVAVRP
jgi:hypothetical protein